MANDQQQNSNEESPGHTEPTPASTDGQQAKKNSDTKTQTGDCRYIEQKPPTIIVNVPERPEPKWKTDHTLTFIAIIFNAGLIYFTFLLFQKTSIQADKAAESATAAKVADSLTEIALNRDSIRSIRAESSDSVKFWKQYDLANSTFKRTAADDNRRFRLDSLSAQAQIAVLDSTREETKSEFNILNEPYLQILAPTYDTGGPSRRLAIIFEIANLGNYPAKVIGLKVGILACLNAPTASDTSNAITDSLSMINSYLVKDNPHRDTVAGDSVFTLPSNIAFMATGKYTVYFWGYIEYINLITERPRIYTFKITVPAKIGAKGSFVWNENKDALPTLFKKVIPLGLWNSRMFTDSFP